MAPAVRAIVRTQRARAGRLSTGSAILLGDTLEAPITARQAAPHCRGRFPARIAAHSAGADAGAVVGPVHVDRSIHPVASVSCWRLLGPTRVGGCAYRCYFTVFATTRSSGFELARSAVRCRVLHELVRRLELAVGSIQPGSPGVTGVLSVGVAVLVLVVRPRCGGPHDAGRLRGSGSVERTRRAGADVNRTGRARKRCHQNRQSCRVPHHE